MLRKTYRNILSVGHSRSGCSQRLAATGTRQSRDKSRIGSGSTVIFSYSDETSDCARVESVLDKAALDFGFSGNCSGSSCGDSNRVGRGCGDGRVCVGDSSEKVRKISNAAKRHDTYVTGVV